MQSLTYEGSAVTWLRGGTSPEVWRTTFEHTTNGMVWTGVGAGTRIAGGWQLDGLALPSGGVIRARGYVSGGYQNGSAWYVERLLSVFSQTEPLFLTDGAGFGVISNGFALNIGGVSGQVLVVEGTTNLLHWTALYTNQVSGGSLYFSDPGSTNFAWRFYRARLWP